MGNKRGRKPRLSIRLMRKKQGQNVYNKQTVAVAATSTAADDDNDHHDDIISPEKLPSDPELSTAADDDYDHHDDIISPEKLPSDPELSTAADDDYDHHDDIISPEKLPSDPELSTAADEHDNIDYTVSPEKSCSDPEPARGSETAMRRIVDVNNFFDQLKEISSHGPLSCGLKAVDIISETRTGLISQIKLKCKMCNETFTIYNDNPTNTNELDLNTSAVAGTISIGCGYSQLTDLCAAIGIPRMTKTVFSSKLDVVHRVWERELLKSMADAAEEERRLAMEENRVNPNGIPIIDVIADGCYGKRSYKKNYSSLSGAAAIIGKRTNKILYLAIKNKYCCICAQAEKNNREAKDHKCYKNFTGASTGMESEILVEGFKSSIDMHNLIYGRLISDGDANTYAKILQTRPYDNYTVEKIECRNHLLRNMCNKLAATATDTKYSLKYRKYVNNKRILSIRKVVTKAIAQYKNTNDITSLHQDILTASDHAFGRHSSCKEYFCTKGSDKTENIEQEIFCSSLWQRIRLIMTQLAAHARSLILDVDSNSVERFHSIVAKFVGGKRINFSQRYQYTMRCNAAALSFNSRAPVSTLHRAIIRRSPRNEAKKNEERKEKSRSLAKKYLRKKRRLLQKQDSKNYGEDCSKPDMEEDMMNQSKIVFLENLKKNQDERERIERETVLQSGCSEWLELRRNILTASNFGRVIKRRADISCQNIVKDMLYKKSIDHVAAIKHGKKYEKDALHQLAGQENIEINKCGLYIDPEIPYLGATPDGVVSPDMIVEVKCPTTTYNIGVEKAVETKKFPVYKKNKNGQLELNKDHNYYYQIQGQLHVTGKNQCLFGIWSGEDLPIKVEIIKKDDDFWSSKMEEKLKIFYIDCLLPELIDPRYTRKMPIRDPLYITEAIAQKEAKKLDAAKLATSTATCPDQPTTSTAMLTGHFAQKHSKKRPISTVSGTSRTGASKRKRK